MSLVGCNMSHLVGGEEGVVVGLLPGTGLLDACEVLGHVRRDREVLFRVETKPGSTQKKNIKEQKRRVFHIRTSDPETRNRKNHTPGSSCHMYDKREHTHLGLHMCNKALQAIPPGARFKPSMRTKHRTLRVKLPSTCARW